MFPSRELADWLRYGNVVEAVVIDHRAGPILEDTASHGEGMRVREVAMEVVNPMATDYPAGGVVWVRTAEAFTPAEATCHVHAIGDRGFYALLYDNGGHAVAHGGQRRGDVGALLNPQAYILIEDDRIVDAPTFQSGANPQRAATADEVRNHLAEAAGTVRRGPYPFPTPDPDFVPASPAPATARMPEGIATPSG